VSSVVLSTPSINRGNFTRPTPFGGIWRFFPLTPDKWFSTLWFGYLEELHPIARVKPGSGAFCFYADRWYECLMLAGLILVQSWLGVGTERNEIHLISCLFMAWAYDFRHKWNCTTIMAYPGWSWNISSQVIIASTYSTIFVSRVTKGEPLEQILCQSILEVWKESGRAEMALHDEGVFMYSWALGTAIGTSLICMFLHGKSIVVSIQNINICIY